jgi:undecaprenyl diphosphate synthase
LDIHYGTRLGSGGLRFSRIPRHVGFIPDGNRRWADARGAPRRDGYSAGILPGLALLNLCQELGIEEVSVYGFTKENVRRPSEQVHAFRDACVEFGLKAVAAGAALHVIGDVNSTLFPDELRSYASKRSPGGILLNLLVNYGWQWDLAEGMKSNKRNIRRSFSAALASGQASRVNLVVRWGGRRRLSGFLPVQCAYADIYVVDTLWPDMRTDELITALRWYEKQDVTLGG